MEQRDQTGEEGEDKEREREERAGALCAQK